MAGQPCFEEGLCHRLMPLPCLPDLSPRHAGRLLGVRCSSSTWLSPSVVRGDVLITWDPL